MQQIKLDNQFEKMALEKAGIIFTNDYCTSETAMKDYGKPVHEGNYRMMMELKTEKIFCPKCKLYAQSKNVSYTDTQISETYVDREKKKYLQKYSIFAGKSFLNKGMKHFQAVTPKEKEVFNAVKKITASIASGEIVTVLMTGAPGSGKSHLAYSLASNVNEMSADRKGQLTCAFVDFNELINRILADYEHRMEILNTVKLPDVLVIDDVGTEVGKTNTAKSSSDHTYKSFLEIINAREGIATTIITSNLSMQQIEHLYDDRLSSRLSSNLVVIDFDGIADKRKGMSM